MITYIDETFFVATTYASKRLREISSILVGKQSTESAKAAFQAALGDLEREIMMQFRVPLRFSVQPLSPTELTVHTYIQS